MDGSSGINPINFVHDCGAFRVEGFCGEGYERVANVFVENFLTRREIGAAACLFHNGRAALDLWGGLADVEEGRIWSRDTLVTVFSCTNAATSLCLHLLESRNRLDLDMPIAELWPEFAAHGKGSATVRMILDHTLGLPAIRRPLKADCLLDHEYMTLLAAEPGSRTGYHALNMDSWRPKPCGEPTDGR
jgi:CubicO group peptidase (beta-lactamase class C family)